MLIRILGEDNHVQQFLVASQVTRVVVTANGTRVDLSDGEDVMVRESLMDARHALLQALGGKETALHAK